jgi:hypothetical protein
MVTAIAVGKADQAITVSFTFNPPAVIQKAAAYTIGGYGKTADPVTGAVMSSEFAHSDPYSSGQAVDSTNVPLNPPADRLFTTDTLR